jgi:hypothetical protein
MDNITIGYLSWKRNDVFIQTLKSHKPLFELIKHRVIFFQEISQKDREIAKVYGCEVIGSSKNIGIHAAFIELIKYCKTEYFIFCENDWNLIENKEKTKSILEDCVKLCDNNILVKLRHRENPGIPLYSMPKNVNEWLKSDVSNFPYKLESLSWVKNVMEVYSDLEEMKLNNTWYITTLEHQKWSNNVFISNIHILRNIIQFIGNNLHLYSGLEDVLIKRNDLGFKLAGGDGLFTHLDKIN